MSKAILSLLFVVALFNSGLVLANPAGSGDAVKNIADKGGDLAKKAIQGLGEGYEDGSLEKTAIDLGGQAVNALVDGLGNLAGGAINGAESGGKKVKDLANAGYDRAKDALQGSGNKGGNNQQQPQQQQQQGTNGGNTVQIPTLFFLILAIFNH